MSNIYQKLALAIMFFVPAACLGAMAFIPTPPIAVQDALSPVPYKSDAVVQVAIGSDTEEQGFMAVATCTGTVIGDGYVLTAGHCADMPAAIIAWEPIDHQTRKTKLATKLELMAVNTKYDVALYRMDRKDWASSFIRAKLGEPARLAEKNAKIGDTVYTEGFPGPFEHIRNYGKVSSGLVKWANWPVCQIINVVGAPGISGGPVFNTAGEIVGIFNGGPVPFGGQGAMVPVSVIRAVLGLDIA